MKKDTYGDEFETDQTKFGYLANVGRGFVMGMADVVPGVSGGTVALVTGIYYRLVTAISRFDAQAVSFLTSKRFVEFSRHVDLKFLLTLGAGIASGFILTVKTLAHYLESESSRSFLLAIFLGMILAAIVIVVRIILKTTKDGIRQQVAINWLAVIVGVGIAVLITQMSPSSLTRDPALWFLFVCGMFGICAMILPGISGALILMLLGVYEYLVHVAEEILSFDNLTRNLLISICFAAGCASGLILFSRVLRRLLEQRPGPTMSLLCGLIVGSLHKLWPFQVNTTPDVEDFKQRIYQAVWPETIDSRFWLHVLLVAVAMVGVLLIEWAARRTSGQLDQ